MIEPSELEEAGAGEVRLIDADERPSLEAAALGAGRLFASFMPPGPGARGRLALLLEEAVEGALSLRGAAPPGFGASSDLDATLSDQLFRARSAGFRGLTLALPALEGIANLAGALDAEDSAVLRWWIAAAQERAVHLYVDARNRFLGVYGEPVALALLLVAGDAPTHEILPAPEQAASAAAMELSAPLPRCAVLDDFGPLALEPSPPLAPVDIERFTSQPPAVEVEEPLEATAPPPVVGEPATHLEGTELARAMAAIFEDDEAVASAPLTGLDESFDAALAEYARPAGAPSSAPQGGAGGAALDDEAPADEGVSAAGGDERAERVEAPVEPRRSTPLHPRAREQWTEWMRELDGARGPKPLGAIERLFASAYVPLADAVARGLAGPRAVEVLAAWATSFERSYTEAFDALRLRGKRPTMVLDAPEVAQRIGRLHGARSVQLFIIDSLRFDLGLRVQERARALVGQRAALTERLLLWSALPTITEVQLELIGRGPAGLKDLVGEVEAARPVVRGRSAATIRRLKAGHRELYKLDLVESRLAEAGGPLAERLDDLADEVAESLAAHLLGLPPRTLVMVFGDHGFVLDPLDGGTAAARQGGATPDEVLVPGFAWLTGDVH
ncbi:MAG: hypothetical protein OZ921_12645 [Sorangiineae bacterium]|nr:hypothetical protein [Polyangiaceae bacterium]MEB2323355.1 hypothetical protein [Sorangiineae bacterium]